MLKKINRNAWFVANTVCYSSPFIDSFI